MRGAEGEDGERDRHADEGAEQAPQEGPEEDREQHDDGRDRQHRARDTRLDVAADHELDDVQAGEDAEHRRPVVELGHRQQGRKQRRDERTDERDVVEHEGDHAPFQRERQAGEPGERTDQQAGDRAHQGSHHEISSQLCRGGHAAVQQHGGGRPVLQSRDPSTEVLDLEQSQHHVDQRDHPEGQRGIDAACHVLGHAQHPADVEMFGPQRGQ